MQVHGSKLPCSMRERTLEIWGKFAGEEEPCGKEHAMQLGCVRKGHAGSRDQLGFSVGHAWERPTVLDVQEGHEACWAWGYVGFGPWAHKQEYDTIIK